MRSSAPQSWHRQLVANTATSGRCFLCCKHIQAFCLVKQGGRTEHEDSGSHRVMTSSLTTEVEAVTHAILWLASQRDAQITHAIILTGSMNLLQKVKSGMAVPTDTQPCTVFGYKDFCGSTVLGTPKSAEMNGQIDWQAQQISHLTCSLAGLRCSEASGTF